jgi:hypothetical protein
MSGKRLFAKGSADIREVQSVDCTALSLQNSWTSGTVRRKGNKSAKTKLSQKSKFHYSPRRPRFAPRSVQVGFLVEKVTLNQVFSESFGFPLSILFQSCSIFIHVSCARWTKGPLAAAVSQRHSLTPLQQ